MDEHITASPLCWPEGWGRAKQKTVSRFSKISIASATHFILEELRRMGISKSKVIVSTNLRLKNDGLPYSQQRSPDDVGAAVWWADKNGEQKVIALDKYNNIADNIYAIGKTIEAMRGIERWGGGEILNRTFTGFVALPDFNSIASWREVLGYNGQDIIEAKEAYMRARSRAHPDHGGDDDQYHEVKQAWQQAKQELLNE